MAMNIYVGNLNFNVSEEDLRDIFSDYASLKTVKLIRDKDTGRSKGFAFLYFEDRYDGEHALQEMVGINVNGRPLRVSIATQQSNYNYKKDRPVEEKRHFSPKFNSSTRVKLEKMTE